jgi:hypothetical protein
MSTIRQIQANQQNAQRSTGPRTVEGKAIISRNALKSGIDAKSILIVGETSADLEALQAEYFGRWLPTTPEQRALVDSLVENEWLMRRYRRLETHLWNDCMPDQSRFRKNAYLSQALISGEQLFDRVVRHKNSAQRNYRAALRDLERLKKEELATPPSDSEPLNPTPIGPQYPQPIEIAPASTSIGFVPATQLQAPDGAPPTPYAGTAVETTVSIAGALSSVL